MPQCRDDAVSLSPYRVYNRALTSPEPDRAGASSCQAVTRMVVDDTAAREELIEALAHLNASAKRAQRIVERFSNEEPSVWTRAHREINDMLDLIVGR